VKKKKFGENSTASFGVSHPLDNVNLHFWDDDENDADHHHRHHQQHNSVLSVFCYLYVESTKQITYII
jgi:hypothetical protein